MKAALFQPPYPVKGEEAKTVQWILAKLAVMSPREVELVILPEYSNCLGAGTRDEVLTAIRNDGKRLLEAFEAEAVRLQAVIMAGVVMEDADGHLYNQLMVVEPAKAPYCPYTKNYPVEAELHKGILPGKGPGVFEINGIRYGASICFDFYFPELFAKYCEAEIDVMVMSSLQRRESAERLHYLGQARAFDCGCTVLRSSVAMPGKPEVAGRSMCIGPDGTIIADAGGTPGVLVVEFEPKARFVQPASFDRPGQIEDYRETRLRVRQLVRKY